MCESARLRACGVTVETLRYYGRRGLLPAPERTAQAIGFTLARVVGCACTSGVERPSLLHITNGDSAGNALRQTALGGAVLPWQDALHEGPAPALPRQELLRARAGFLAACGWGRPQTLLSRSSGATGNCSTRSATTSMSCSGSSMTSTTSSSSSTCSPSPTPRRPRPS